MFLSKKIRNFLMFFTCIVLPVVMVLYLSIDAVMIGCDLDGLPHPNGIVEYISITMLILGIILNVSKDDICGVLRVDKMSENNRYRLDFNLELSELEKKESFIIKVEDSTNLNSQI